LELILGKGGGGRKRKASGTRTPEADIYGAGGPQEAAAFIAETTAELSQIADRHGLEMLKHLLDMTRMEAEEWLRKRRRMS
jgi:hypothetical protein